MLNPNKALWEKGDFVRIAEGMRNSGVALVADIGIEPGTHVLDLDELDWRGLLEMSEVELDDSRTSLN